MSNRTFIAAIIISTLLVSSLLGVEIVNIANANPIPPPPKSLPSIQINNDGSINPPTDLVKQNGNIYYLTRDIVQEYVLEISCSNITVDGKNYTIDGGGAGSSGIKLNRVANVTVKNVQLRNFYYDGVQLFGSNCTITAINAVNISFAGIDLRDSNNNTITENQIINDKAINGSSGILLEASQQNRIYGNNVTGMSCVFRIEGNTSINRSCQNNFINNSKPILQVTGDPYLVNSWDNGVRGNYWSDYNGTDANNDGIGDTPYSVDVNNKDNFPLMSPVNTSATSPSPSATVSPSPTVPEFTPAAVLILASAACLFAVAFRKRR